MDPTEETTTTEDAAPPVDETPVTDDVDAKIVAHLEGKKTEPKAPAKKPDEEAKAEPEEAKDDEEKEPDEDKPEAEKPPEKKPDEKKKDEESAAKGLEAVHRAKKRADEQIAAERKKLADERAEFEKQKAELEKTAGESKAALQQIQMLQARAKADPKAAVALVLKLGISKRQLAEVGQRIFAHSDDPRVTDDFRRQYAIEEGADAQYTESERVSRELAEIKERQAKFEKDQAEAAQNAQLERQAQALIEDTASKIAPKHKLLSALNKKNPRKVRMGIESVTHDLWKKHGFPPDKLAVLDALEEELAGVAAELDLVERAAPPKKEPEETGEKKRPETLSQDQTETTRPRPAKKPQTREEEDELLVRQLEENARQRKAGKA